MTGNNFTADGTPADMATHHKWRKRDHREKLPLDNAMMLRKYDCIIQQFDKIVEYMASETVPEVPVSGTICKQIGSGVRTARTGTTTH